MKRAWMHVVEPEHHEPVTVANLQPEVARWTRRRVSAIPVLCSLLSAVVGGGLEQLCGELFGVFGGDGVVADSGQGVDRRIR